jgi:glycerophosphoryl diester phosphodiesterase
MVKRSIYTFFLVVICSLVSAQQRAGDIRRTLLDASSKEVLVATHRATHNVYPENSLKAIQESIKQGVDIIEIDVKVSKDGIPFLMHDRTMDRTTNGKGDPEELTWEELQKLDIVDKGKKTSYKIPSLEAALELADGKILVDLDLKTDRLDRIIEVVNRLDMKESVFFFDSDYDALSRIQSADKDFMIMPRAHSVEEADSAIAMFDPPIVHIDFSFYTNECVELIKNSNARIWINALGDCDKELRAGKSKQALKKLLANGANIIQTDEPELLLKALEKYGYRSPSPSLVTK